MNVKIDSPYKTVMFYGSILRISLGANWIAVDRYGAIAVFAKKPMCTEGRWLSNAEEGRNLPIHAELGDTDWEDTLTHCPHDQQWMIEAAAILQQAKQVYTHESKATAEMMCTHVADYIRARAAPYGGRKAAWDTFKKHAITAITSDDEVYNVLYEKLFPKPKEPDHLVVKDYYGRDIIVPPWARWLAMDEDGEATVFVDEPYKEKEGGWWRRSNYENPRIAVAWFPRHIAKSSWRDSLQEVQPEPSGE